MEPSGVRSLALEQRSLTVLMSVRYDRGMEMEQSPDSGEVVFLLLADGLVDHLGENASLASVVALLSVVGRGARRMVEEGDTNPDDLARGSAAVARFVDEMDVARRQLGYSEFHESTVEAAERKLCPGFWPFC